MSSSRHSIVAVLLACVSSLALPQTPLRNIPGPRGGTILYGAVNGANTSPMAMGAILKQLHSK